MGDIKKLNHLENNHIHAGDKLKVITTSPKTPKRNRSRSMKSGKIMTVFPPSLKEGVKVPNGSIPHVVGENETLEYIGERYNMKVIYYRIWSDVWMLMIG